MTSRDYKSQRSVIMEGFRACSSFSDLDEDILHDLASNAILRHYKAGEFILQEGDQPQFHQLIQSGRVKIFKQSSSGKAFIIGVVWPGQAINATAIIEGRPHFVSAQALDAVTVIRTKRDDHLMLLEKHPSIALKIIATLNDLLDSTYERLMDIVGERVEQRVCNILYMLQAKFGDTLNFTTDEIANLGGMAPETAIRVLTKLKERHIIAGSGRGKLQILDLAKLKKLSRGPFYF